MKSVLLSNSCSYMGNLFAGIGSGAGTSIEKDIDMDVQVDAESISELIETKEEPTESSTILLTIVVKKDRYFIEGEEYSIDKIKQTICDGKQREIIVESNYASAKQWDELIDSLREWGITPVTR